MPASSDASTAASAFLSSTGPQPPPTAHRPVPTAETSMPDLPNKRLVRDFIMDSSSSFCQIKRALQSDFPRRRTNQYFKNSRFRHPVLLRHVVEGQRALV